MTQRLKVPYMTWFLSFHGQILEVVAVRCVSVFARYFALGPYDDMHLLTATKCQVDPPVALDLK